MGSFQEVDLKVSSKDFKVSTGLPFCWLSLDVMGEL